MDVRIKPDVSFMGMVSTAGAEEAIRIGRECAERALPEIEAILGCPSQATSSTAKEEC